MAHLINTDDLKQEAGNIGNWAWNTWLGNEMNNLVGDNPYLNILGQLGLNATNTILNNIALQKQINIANAKTQSFDANVANKLIQQDFETKTGTLNGNPFKIKNNNNQLSIQQIDKWNQLSELYGSTDIPKGTNFAALNDIPKVESSLDLSPDNLSLKKSTNTQTPTEQQNTNTQSSNFSSNLVNGAASSAAGAATSALVNWGANKLLGNSKGAQMTSGVLSQGAGTAAGAIVSNALAGTAGTTATNALGSAFSSASGLAAGGMGVANLALDVFDKVKKSKIESGANIALGVGGLALTAAIPAAGPFVAAAILAANAAGHIAGQKTENFTANRELLAQAGSSYNSSINNILKAESLAGQRYSGYNSGGRHEADKAIYTGSQEQKGLEKVLLNIGSLRDILASTAGLVSQQRELESNGGFQSVYTGKEGTVLNKISYINEAPSIINELSYINEAPSIIEEFQEGGRLDTLYDYVYYLSTLPKYQQNESNYRVKDYWRLNGKPKDFEEAVKKGMFTLEDDIDESGKFVKRWHAKSVAFNPETGEYEFMKSADHPTLHYELEWYNSDDAKDFRKEYELVKTLPYYKYIRRKTISFKEGGSFNIIPEGALHARLHHMEDADNLTKKGIPVVDNNGEQQAEIERNELILRLSVTKYLEELAKEGTDKAAIEAGKLLVNEILYNTVDNTI